MDPQMFMKTIIVTQGKRIKAVLVDNKPVL